jgi:hypothetical protein
LLRFFLRYIDNSGHSVKKRCGLLLPHVSQSMTAARGQPFLVPVGLTGSGYALDFSDDDLMLIGICGTELIGLKPL